MRQLIPNKNRVFEYEKAFLEEKHRQGFKLEKKGWLLYQFTAVSPSEVAYEIDLAPRNREILTEEVTCESLNIFEDWEVVMTQSVLYKNLEKIYYLNPDPTKRFLVDEEMQTNYYKRTILLWNLLNIPFILVIALWLATAVTTLPSFIDTMMPYLLISTVILALYSARKNAPFSLFRRAARERLGMEVEMPIFYLISFLDLTVEQKNELDENLSIVGNKLANTQKDNVTYYFLTSSIAHIPEMKQEILNMTTVEKEKVKIIRHSGVYSMPFVLSGWDSENAYVE